MISIIGKYSITYWNGITQYKTLISKEVYDTEVKYIIEKANEIQSKMWETSKKNKKYGELEKEFKRTIAPIKELGEYFIEGSPLYNSIDSGILILPDYKGLGGTISRNVTIKLI